MTSASGPGASAIAGQGHERQRGIVGQVMGAARKAGQTGYCFTGPKRSGRRVLPAYAQITRELAAGPALSFINHLSGFICPDQVQYRYVHGP